MKFSTSINFLFNNLPFVERFQAAAKAGFGGVEIQLLEVSADECAKASLAANIPVILLNVDMGDLLKGGSGLSGVPGREDDFRDAVHKAVEAANKMKAHYIHLGPSRIPAGLSRDACKGAFIANLNAIRDSGISETSQAKFLIEPMNHIDMPDALFTDVDEVSSLIHSDYVGFVGLQFDIYHICKNGGDAVSLFRQHADLIDHIQFSDLPNRCEPGTGELDFKRIFSEISARGYQGWFGAEYFSSKPTLETLDWLKTMKDEM
jgi:hydroxypyruvate isomerase